MGFVVVVVLSELSMGVQLLWVCILLKELLNMYKKVVLPATPEVCSSPLFLQHLLLLGCGHNAVWGMAFTVWDLTFLLDDTSSCLMIIRHFSLEKRLLRLFTWFLRFIFMCVCISIYIHGSPQGPKESVRFPGTRVTDGWEPPDVGAGAELES